MVPEIWWNQYIHSRLRTMLTLESWRAPISMESVFWPRWLWWLIGALDGKWRGIIPALFFSAWWTMVNYDFLSRSIYVYIYILYIYIHIYIYIFLYIYIYICRVHYVLSRFTTHLWSLWSIHVHFAYLFVINVNAPYMGQDWDIGSKRGFFWQELG